MIVMAFPSIFFSFLQAKIIKQMNIHDMENLMDLFHKVGKLKEIKRKGWIRYNIPSPESVAEHVFRVAFIAMMVGKEMDADVLKLLKMALIHDVPEVICGDITPHNGISQEKKRRMEEDAIKRLFSKLPDGKEYVELWEEIEEGKSKEAKILKDIDKLELMLQASEYKQKYPDKNLFEFIIYGKQRIKSRYIRSMAEMVEKESL